MTQTNETLLQEELRNMKFGECLLPFGSESLSFVSLSLYKYKGLNTQKHNYACFLWV